MLMSYLKLIGTALAALTNIRSLELNLASFNYVSILEHVTLPRMYKFATSLPFTPELISFLNRHTAIRDLVLVGDPRQLAQPLQGTHPEGVGISALDHLLSGDVTIAPERGVLLDRTWRMHPDVTAFVSRSFYEQPRQRRE